VCVQLLTDQDADPMDAYTRLAAALGLSA